MKLTTNLLLVPRLRKSEALLLLLPSAFTVWTGKIYLLPHCSVDLTTASGCAIVVCLRTKFGNGVDFAISLRVNFSALSQKCEKRLLASSRLGVRPPAGNNSAPPEGGGFVKFDI